jgi:hypothetical protein
MVFGDYDVDQAVNYAAFGAFIGAGQTCVCASRHIVQATIYDEFVEKLRAKTEAIRIGDPFDPATQLGPVISARQRDRVLTYCGYGRDDGARLVAGGGAAQVPGHANGYFVQPTVFADVKSDMRIFQEEVFGPFTSVTPFTDEADALRSPTIPRSGWRRRSAPATSAAPIASRLRSRRASSGSTIITGSTRPRPGAGSMIQASGANSALRVSTTISTPRA